MYIILHCSSSCKFHVTNLSRDISDVFLEIQEFVQDWRMIDEKSGAQQQQNIAVKATCDLFSSACDPFAGSCDLPSCDPHAGSCDPHAAAAIEDIADMEREDMGTKLGMIF